MMASDKKNSVEEADKNKSVDKSDLNLYPLMVKMERRKKISRLISAISSLIIIVGLGLSGYYLYNAFQPVESGSISFDNIQEATPEEKEKSEEYKNMPITEEYGRSEDSSNGSAPSSGDKKNIQNGSIPEDIDNMPEQSTYIYTGGGSQKQHKYAEHESEINSGEESKSDSSNSEYSAKKIKGSGLDSSDNEDYEDSDGSSKKSSTSKKSENSKKVTLTITGSNGNDVLGTKSIKFSGTQTVASILFSACDKYNIPYKYKGSGSSIYVSSIGGLSEKSDGSGSGWMVRVNGKLIDKSAGAWKVKDDDDIEWFYYSGSMEDIPTE